MTFPPEDWAAQLTEQFSASRDIREMLALTKRFALNMGVLLSGVGEGLPMHEINPNKAETVYQMRVCSCALIWNRLYHGLPLRLHGQFGQFCAKVFYPTILSDPMVVEFIKIPADFVYYRRYFETYLKSYGYDDDIRRFYAPDYLIEYSQS